MVESGVEHPALHLHGLDFTRTKRENHVDPSDLGHHPI